MSKSELVDQLAVSLGFLDRIEVFTLVVFDKRLAQQMFVGNVSNDRGNGGPAESAGGTKSTLARDQFKLPIRSGPN
jgi:hypothetical protein